MTLKETTLFRPLFNKEEKETLRKASQLLEVCITEINQRAFEKHKDEYQIYVKNEEIENFNDLVILLADISEADIECYI